MSLVTDYRLTTWNSRGYKLHQVFDSFASNSSLNIFFVQESGNLADKRLISIQQNLPFYLNDGSNSYLCGASDFVKVYQYQDQRVNLYIYNFFPPPNVLSTLSLTIVSRVPADSIIYFASLTRRPGRACEREFTNRPVAGITIGNDVFLNIHAEPTGIRNEVPDQLDAIRNHMRTHAPLSSWLLAGDFNRMPSSLQLQPYNEQFVVPPLNTHGNKILDYLILGSNDVRVFQQMVRNPYSGIVDLTLTGSDHKAVHFSL
ncbi:cytolethal distending toxin subunit B homolog [Drosophila biarmipes]|uniref:cytolethal distending toxin subunit B homolog n=1 Tax=Drosophila biarmipes TaxID=125945 RepID=UPI0021CCC296|nr:cytolethal distending toxin subunit B homolog [Drosophila biarmipes]